MLKKIERIRSDCDNPWECEACPDKPTCDEIEDMVQMSKKLS